MTGGRLKRIAHLLDPTEPFCFTYGDGVSDINISETIRFHRNHGKKSTLVAVQPPGRYGALELSCDKAVMRFKEKPGGDGAWINGGFFVLNRDVVKLIHQDSTIWEREPMESLAQTGELMAFKHHGFWQPMDTLRDKKQLETLWQSGNAPWKVW